MSSIFKKKSICLIILGIVSVMLSFATTSCRNRSSSNNNSSEAVASSEFVSEQDVINYCIGKTFSRTFLDMAKTVRSAKDVTVKEFSGETAVVEVWYDMSEIYGRAVVSGFYFKINKKTGECIQLNDYE